MRNSHMSFFKHIKAYLFTETPNRLISLSKGRLISGSALDMLRMNNTETKDLYMMN